MQFVVVEAGLASDGQDVLIEHCGHYPAEERPDELAGAIRDFLAKPLAGSPR